MPEITGFLVRSRSAGQFVEANFGKWESVLDSSNVSGRIQIQFEFSSLNYKDALAALGHPGIVRNLPHIPGIDAAGTVIESDSNQFRIGDQVIVQASSFGTECWGGWANRGFVQEDWLIRLPASMTAEQAMQIGTAGFTAAMSVEAIQKQGITPASGTVLVTGATGGVGSTAVALLARLGFRVAALTGKMDQSKWLQSIGANEIIDRNEWLSAPGKPLQKTRWSAVIETTGGKVLSRTLSEVQSDGCVAASGMVAGIDFESSIYPFILRGIRLIGVDSGNRTAEYRREIWSRLAGDLEIPHLGMIARTIRGDSITTEINAMLSGKQVGRIVVDVRSI